MGIFSLPFRDWCPLQTLAAGTTSAWRDASRGAIEAADAMRCVRAVGCARSRAAAGAGGAGAAVRRERWHDR
eukprot:4096853-Pyramimonas_sp.AAC.1